jgi:protein phosphatase
MKYPDLSAAIEMATCTDTGMVRGHNEDSILANNLLGLAVLADGMGGYNAGEVASGIATAVLGSELEAAFTARAPHEPDGSGRPWVRQALEDVVARTNAAIHLAARSNPKYTGMGTTLVMVQFFDNRLMVAHVGDSRLYRLRDGVLAQVTKDHSLLQQQIDSGLITPEEARHSQNKNLVTRALGVDPTVETEIAEHEVREGDIYLLCSDGLNDMVTDEEIALVLTTLAANLPLCATHLVQSANDNGGRDNVSVILAKVKAPFPATGTSSGWLTRVQSWFK